jgi:hypothetical protein
MHQYWIENYFLSEFVPYLYPEWLKPLPVLITYILYRKVEEKDRVGACRHAPGCREIGILTK